MASNVDREALPAGWLESLERSKSQIAAGMSVPLIPILDRLRASAEQLEAAHKQPPKEADEPSHRDCALTGGQRAACGPVTLLR